MRYMCNEEQNHAQCSKTLAAKPNIYLLQVLYSYMANKLSFHSNNNNNKINRDSVKINRD